MWRFIDQLVNNIRSGRLDREAKALRSTRLAIETLETRTVLSANFGVDYEAQTYFEFTAPPPPRILVAHEMAAALATVFAEDAPPMFAEDRLSAGSAESPSYVLLVQIRPDRREMVQGWSGSKPPLGAMWYGHRSPAAAANLEDGPFGSLSISNEGPLRGQAPTSSKGDAGANNLGNLWLASSFDPPQASSLEAVLKQTVETRHVTTSPFVAPISGSTSDDAELADSASLLATYATLAASIDDVMATSHDAAFGGYSTLRDGEADREQYMQLLAEDQTRDAAGEEAGGFADLDEARIDGAEDLSNMAADNQREAVESALRSLAARRSDARTSLLPENWLEQAWLSTEVAEQDAASANQVADEPGGMILLPPMADGAGDELIAAGDVDEVIKTAVEMEATIGAFQAFDVSVDEAPAAVAKPAPTNELGAEQQRDASTAETTDRQAASGLGVVAVGAMALIAKRKIDDRRRKPKSTA
jgi:hypothetical protein